MAVVYRPMGVEVLEQILAGLVAQAAPDAGGAGGFISMLPIVLMFGVIYFLMIRPQQKQAKKHREYLGGLKKGDEVVTNAGIYGKIDAVSDAFVTLEIARDVKIRVVKSQVAGAQPGTAEAAATLPAKKD